MKIKNKIVIALAVIFTLSLSVGLFVGCDKAGTKKEETKNEMDLYAFGAMSSGAILESFHQKDINTNASAAEGTVADNTEATAEQIEEIKNYMAMVDGFLGSDPLSMKEVESDREDYAKKIIINNSDLNGNNYTYVLYFNETNVEEENDDDDEVEIESRIDGIMLLNDHEYIVIGEKEIEGEEFEISFIAKIDENNYVYINQEIEADGKEFEYEVYENGVKISKFSIEIENENNETEVEMKVQNGTTTEFFKFSKEVENNKTFVKVIAEKDGVKSTIKVSIVTNADGTEEYNFISGNTEIKHDKPDFDDD